ncbi:MAG: DOMON-like domain-containing protein [Candidatus Binatia bacterium]
MEKAVGPLVPHPAAPPSPGVEVLASAALDPRGLVLRWSVRAAPHLVATAPRAARPGRRDRLWEHTCCEAFVGRADGDAYLEVNIAPSEDWALWAFDGYRAGMRAAACEAPRMRVLRMPRELRVDAIVDPLAVQGFLGEPPYVVGLTAVVEEQDGRRSYFALAHAGERPDFHARASWTSEVYAEASA